MLPKVLPLNLCPLNSKIAFGVRFHKDKIFLTQLTHLIIVSAQSVYDNKVDCFYFAPQPDKHRLMINNNNDKFYDILTLYPYNIVMFAVNKMELALLTHQNL